jgi:hypothetical protein
MKLWVAVWKKLSNGYVLLVRATPVAMVQGDRRRWWYATRNLHAWGVDREVFSTHVAHYSDTDEHGRLLRIPHWAGCYGEAPTLDVAKRKAVVEFRGHVGVMLADLEAPLREARR